MTQDDTNFGVKLGEIKMRYTRICSFCGKEFTAFKSCTQYCSHQCSQRAYKARHRAMNRKAVVLRDQEQIISEYTKKEVVSIREAIVYLGISRSTVFRYIQSGMIPSMKLGATVRLRRADLDYLFERRLPYSKEERIIEVAESKVGSSTEDEPNEYIAAKYVSKREACKILGVCNATAWKLFKKHKLESISFGNSKYYKRSQIENLSRRRNKEQYPEITDWISKEEIKEMFSMTDSAIYSLVSERSIPKKPHIGSTVLYSRKHIYEAKHFGVDFKKEYYRAEDMMELMGLSRNQLHNRLRGQKIRRITVKRTLWINKADFVAAYGELE